MDQKEVLQQSQNAFDQWKDVWKKNAKLNGKILARHKTSHQELLHTGYGKNLVCIAMGASFEKEIENIVKYKNKYDVACVDKAYGYLIERGIIPKYVFMADAAISFSDWIKKNIEKTKNSILISNVTGNPEWTENWKGKQYFYINKDNIKTQDIYGSLSGCQELIPAGSNVGNALMIFSTQIFDYDNYLMVGFDFSWGKNDNYYAFCGNIDKRYYMKHHYQIDNRGNFVATSGNLLFSFKWLRDFLTNFHREKHIYNCSNGLLFWNVRKFENIIHKLKNRKIDQKAKELIMKSRIKKKTLTSADGQKGLMEAFKKLNVVSVDINHIVGEIV